MRLDRAAFLAYAMRRLIGLCLATGLALAGLVTLLSPVAYTASSRVLVSPQAGLLATADSAALIAFLQQRVQTYAEMVGSPAVLAPVARRHGLPEGELSALTAAEVVPGTQLIEITVKGSTPSRAAGLANEVADQLTREVTRVELQGTGTSVPIAVSVVQRASPPAPTGKPLARNLLLGLLAGLAVAALLFLARWAFGRDVTDVEAIIDVTGAPPIATLGAVRRADRSPLAGGSQPHSSATEAYRRLAATMRYADNPRPARSVVVIGITDDSGACTVAGNLGVALAEAGRRVIVVDADLRHPQLPALPGVKPRPGLTDALAGVLDLEPLFQPCGGGHLAVLPAGELPADPGGVLGSADMRGLMQRLAKAADVVLIGAPALLAYSEGTSLAAITEGTILVVRYGQVRASHLQQAVDVLDHVHAALIGTVFFGVPRRTADVAGTGRRAGGAATSRGSGRARPVPG